MRQAHICTLMTKISTEIIKLPEDTELITFILNIGKNYTIPIAECVVDYSRRLYSCHIFLTILYNIVKETIKLTDIANITILKLVKNEKITIQGVATDRFTIISKIIKMLNNLLSDVQQIASIREILE